MKLATPARQHNTALIFRDTGLLQLTVTQDWEKLAATTHAVPRRISDKNHKTVVEL